jgi:hypothetical protein
VVRNRAPRDHLGGGCLCPAARQVFHRDEEVLTAFALKAILLHVVRKIRELGPRLCFHPFPRKEARSQSAGKGKESQVAVEHGKDNPEGDSEKYRGQGNPEVIDIDRTKNA